MGCSDWSTACFKLQLIPAPERTGTPAKTKTRSESEDEKEMREWKQQRTHGPAVVKGDSNVKLEGQRTRGGRRNKSGRVAQFVLVHSLTRAPSRDDECRHGFEKALFLQSEMERSSRSLPIAKPVAFEFEVR